MKWDKVKESLFLVGAHDNEKDGDMHLEFQLEIFHLPYVATFVIPETGERYFERIVHTDKEYWCPFCNQHSQTEASCEALFLSETFYDILVEKINEAMERVQLNERHKWSYSSLSKEEFQSYVHSMLLIYDPDQDCFHSGFLLGDDYDIYAPYMMLGIQYQRDEQDHFTFDLSNTIITHYEGGVMFDNNLVTDFSCECGHTYSHERFKRRKPPILCDIFRFNTPFKEWAWESLTQEDGFKEEVIYQLKHSEMFEIREPQEIQKADIVSLEEYRKKKEQ